MKYEPWIVGSGMAGRALARALEWAAANEGVELAPARWIGRDEVLGNTGDGSIVCIANPHRLHVERLMQVRDLPGAVICEKPVAVTLADIERLADYPKPVAVCHGYRMLWGPRAIRQWVSSGRLGDLVAVEGRYWQCSAAAARRADGWKNDVELSGPYDTLMDLCTHWLDLACFVLDDFGPEVDVSLAYGNAARPHRDTHVLLNADWGTCPGAASVSKTAHGSGNDLEIHVIGTEAKLAWEFGNPDGLWLGEGRSRRWLPRDEPLRSGLPADHGLGWMEGYVAIAAAVLSGLRGKSVEGVPSLPESLRISRLLIDAAHELPGPGGRR